MTFNVNDYIARISRQVAAATIIIRPLAVVIGRATSSRSGKIAIVDESGARKVNLWMCVNLCGDLGALA